MPILKVQSTPHIEHVFMFPCLYLDVYERWQCREANDFPAAIIYDSTSNAADLIKMHTELLLMALVTLK